MKYLLLVCLFVGSSVFGQSSVYQFGFSCPKTGSVFPGINATNPTIGRPMSITTTNGNPMDYGRLAIGVSNTTWLGYQLPLDLWYYGGFCFLYVSFEFSSYIIFDATGTSTVTFNVPNDPGLIGRTLYAQSFIHDLGLNYLNIAPTPGLGLVIGR